MPTNFSTLDTRFPTFTEEETIEEKVVTIENYLYMLLENLRYALNNLDLRNMNGAAVSQWQETITSPIYAQIEDTEGNVLSLALQAAGIAARVKDAEGNILSLQGTANTLSVQIQNANGDISQLKQTAETMSSQIQNASGDISKLKQTATTLSSQIQSANGNISSLQQTANSLSSQIKSTDGKVSALQQTVDGFTLTAKNGEYSSTIALRSNGVSISSAVISFDGMVLFTDLETDNRYTVINGGNVSTGTISAITMEGNEIIGGTITGTTIRSVSTEDSGFEIYYGSVRTRNLVGGMRYDDGGAGTSTEARNRMFVYTENGWALKLYSDGPLSMESYEHMYIGAGDYLTLQADGELNIYDPQIYPASGRTAWTFDTDGIYYGRTKVVSV